MRFVLAMPLVFGTLSGGPHPRDRGTASAAGRVKAAWARAILALGLVVVSPSMAATPTTHIVEPGESLRTVAETYGCTLTELFVANKGTLEHPHMLGVGASLTIPSCGADSKEADPESQGLPAAKMPPSPRHCAWTADNIDRETLKSRLEESDTGLPDFFHILVVETTLTDSRAYIAEQRVLGLGPVDRSEGWHPGLSVGLFSAIGALDRVAHLGFSSTANVTFRDDSGPLTVTVDALVKDGLRLGKPFGYNRLVQLAGSDRLHDPTGVFRRHHFDATVLKQAFDAASWANQGQARSLRRAPPIKLARGRDVVQIPAAVGTRLDRCQQEACTALTDLARAMCLVTQHERLPASRRLALGEGDTPENLTLLRSSLQRHKRQSPGVLEYPFMRALHASRGYRIFRRAGRQDGWSTLVLGVTSSKGQREYVVAMTGHGKNGALADVARTLAGLMKAEDL